MGADRTASAPASTAADPAAFDTAAEQMRLRNVVHRAALEFGMSDQEARRCGESNSIEIDEVVVALVSARAQLGDPDPDPLAPAWMLMARVVELPKDQPLRNMTTCMLVLQMSMASQLANGCAVGYDGGEGLHVLRPTERDVSANALAGMMSRVALTARLVRELPTRFETMANAAIATAVAAAESADVRD